MEIENKVILKSSNDEIFTVVKIRNKKFFPSLDGGGSWLITFNWLIESSNEEFEKIFSDDLDNAEIDRVFGNRYITYTVVGIEK